MSTDAIGRGRGAVRQHAWLEAVEAFRSAVEEGPLEAADLELLAEAEWWAGHPDEATDALERAFVRHSEEEQPAQAAGVALRLAYLAFRGQAAAVGGGWLARAQEILASVPESAVHGWLEVFGAVAALMGARVDEGLDHVERALELGRRHGDGDVHAMALSFKAIAEVMRGDWRAGVALADQAAATVMSGTLDLRTASDIWCQTIGVFRDVGDLRRAGQWADQAERWMRREGVGGYPGICQVHRAELKMLRGDWPAAEQEARRACDELERFRLMDALGFAHYEVGEVRLRMGDLASASAELDQAYEFGHAAQPGSALVRLANGEPDEAARSISRSLAALSAEGSPADLTGRARLLPAQVEISLARGDTETARAASAELDGIAARFEQTIFSAAALTARGALLLHDEQAAEAVPVLERAWRAWLEAELPYESAHARLLYARALAAGGDLDGARRDLRAARAAFERLGASLDVRRADDLAYQIDTRASAPPARVERTFMFTDIVTSTDLIGLIGDAAWEDLLSWHDRELRAAIAGHGGDEVDHTGDGFFVAFEKATDAVECAVDIQRRLARHRHDHGFAPSVRIGLHTAEATRRGRNFSGGGVHVAARIGAAAPREGILVSSAVVDGVAQLGYPVSAPRPVSLKGIAEPITVHDLDWR